MLRSIVCIWPAQRFAALIWRRESEICQLPVEAQRTLGAFLRQQQRALHLCVVLRDRLNFIATSGGERGTF